MPKDEKYKFQVTVITKVWVDPEDHDQGLNVSTGYDYAHTVKEAEVIIERMARQVPDAIQVFGFYTKINMVVQEILP